ncbi:ORF058 [Infectious spleen and kidney necrosis virus]|nr:ORF058 [Infectious spleen and kidney necrosis virus]
MVHDIHYAAVATMVQDIHYAAMLWGLVGDIVSHTTFVAILLDAVRKQHIGLANKRSLVILDQTFA